MCGIHGICKKSAHFVVGVGEEIRPVEGNPEEEERKQDWESHVEDIDRWSAELNI